MQNHSDANDTSSQQIKRTCTMCKVSKTLDAFTKAKNYKHGRDSRCKECRKSYQKKWASTRKKKHPYRHRKHSLKRKFGITEADYDAMLAEQGGVCAICGRRPETLKRGGKPAKFLDVDHCHTTGKVRGLLCLLCNTALGHLQHNPELLHKAIAYLDRANR